MSDETRPEYGVDESRLPSGVCSNLATCRAPIHSESCPAVPGSADTASDEGLHATCDRLEVALRAEVERLRAELNAERRERMHLEAVLREIADRACICGLDYGSRCRCEAGDIAHAALSAEAEWETTK